MKCPKCGQQVQPGTEHYTDAATMQHRVRTVRDVTAKVRGRPLLARDQAEGGYRHDTGCYRTVPPPESDQQ